MPRDANLRREMPEGPVVSALFLDGVHLRKWLKVALSLGLLSAVVLAASELNIPQGRPFSLSDFVQNILVYSACTLMALIFAEKSSLASFLLVKDISWFKKAATLLTYGGLPGLAMGVAYHRSFVAYRFSPYVPFRVRHMKTWYDSFILSLSAAITEELVFRLLLFTAFFHLLSRLFGPMMAINPWASRSIPLLFSWLLSSLLFGVVHGAYGFLFAFVAGLALCLIFLKGGLESAIAAHFLANVVFFQLTYLR